MFRLASLELQTSSFRVEFTDNDFDVTAEAAATFDDNVVGFRVTDKTPNASLLPFTVKVQDWAALLAGVQATDSFTFDPNTGAVVPRSDGVPELKMYPGAASKNGKHITPGNWGAVDIGNTNNSTADLRRQIRDGVSADDLDPYGMASRVITRPNCFRHARFIQINVWVYLLVAIDAWATHRLTSPGKLVLCHSLILGSAAEKGSGVKSRHGPTGASHF